jgi:hypothetical protein
MEVYVSNDYLFFIQTDLEPKRVLTILFEALGFEATLHKHVAVPYTRYYGNLPVKGTELQSEIAISSLSEPLQKSVMLPYLSQLLGISQQPDSYVEISFTLLSPSDFYVESVRQIIQAIGVLLQNIDGDCVWVQEFSYIPGLVRKSGRIIIDPSIWPWDEKDMQALGVPFVIEKLPFDPKR